MLLCNQSYAVARVRKTWTSWNRSLTADFIDFGFSLKKITQSYPQGKEPTDNIEKKSHLISQNIQLYASLEQ